MSALASLLQLREEKGEDMHEGSAVLLQVLHEGSEDWGMSRRLEVAAVAGQIRGER